MYVVTGQHGKEVVRCLASGDGRRESRERAARGSGPSRHATLPGREMDVPRDVRGWLRDKNPQARSVR